MSALDALETSAGEVFRRLNMDSLVEKTEKLKNRQQSLQEEMARKNHEYNHFRGRPVPVHSPMRPESKTSPAPETHSTTQTQAQPLATQPQGFPRKNSPSSGTYARASEALQRARQARQQAAPEAPTTQHPTQVSPLPTSPHTVHSRAVSPVRAMGNMSFDTTISSVSPAVAKPRQVAAVLESSFHAPSAGMPSVSPGGRRLQAIPTPVLPAAASPSMTREDTVQQHPAPVLSITPVVDRHHPESVGRDTGRRQGTTHTHVSHIKTPPTPSQYGSPQQAQYNHAPNTGATVPVQEEPADVSALEAVPSNPRNSLQAPGHMFSTGTGTTGSTYSNSVSGLFNNTHGLSPDRDASVQLSQQSQQMSQQPSQMSRNLMSASGNGSLVSAQQWTPSEVPDVGNVDEKDGSDVYAMLRPDEKYPYSPEDESQQVSKGGESHREEMRLACEIHAQQQRRIQKMEELLQSHGISGDKLDTETDDDALSTRPHDSAVIDELRKIQEQNTLITDKLSQQVDALHSPPGARTPRTPGSPASRKNPNQKRQKAHSLMNPTSWSPSSIRVGAKANKHMRRPSEFDGDSASESSEDDGMAMPRYARANSERFSYTRNALQARSRGGRRRDESQHDYAFGSTLKIKIEPVKQRSSSLRSSRSTARPLQRTSSAQVAPPPNRHRRGSLGAASSGTGGTQEGHSASFKRPKGDGPLRREVPEVHTPPPSERGPSESPVETSDALVIPLPACCSALHLSDEGVSPKAVVQVAQIHLQEVVVHYLAWLKPSSTALELEEASAILSMLPLSSLSSHGFAASLQAVLALLGQYKTLPKTVLLFLLRVLLLLSTSRAHEHLQEWTVIFNLLLDIMRHEAYVSLMPNVVHILLAFGTRGLSVLIKEALGEPPAHDVSPMEEGGVSGFNSCLLTLLANQPSVICSVVVPLVLRDLRDGTPERAEAACNALVGLHKYHPQVLGQLGEALENGKFDRRVVCMAVRVLGGTEGVSLLKSLLGHQSHRVRQAAVWGLGLHAPESDTNEEFDKLQADQEARPAFASLRARCTTVVHAELPALDIIQSPPNRLPPPVLYFQPQLAPECAPYIETHIIVDASVLLQQCSDLIRSDDLDLSIGQKPQQVRHFPAGDTHLPVRVRFIHTAKELAHMNEDDARNMTLFLGTFRPITEGRGVLSASFVEWQRSLRMPGQGEVTNLPVIPKSAVTRIVSSLITLASAGGDSPQELKVKEEALHVLRWFPADIVEPGMRHLRGVLHGPHPTLRSGVIVLLAELVRSGQEHGAVSNIVGTLTSKLNDPHPRVRLACIVALRTTTLPSSLLSSLMRYLKDGKINRFQVAHTIACVVPKGVTALVDASMLVSADSKVRKACLYGLGWLAPQSRRLHLDHPKLNEAVAQCLATACREDNTAEVREQALLSLGCFAGILASPSCASEPAPPQEDALSVGDHQRKGKLVRDTAVSLVHSDDHRLRGVAATVLALCGKQGVLALQEVILKPKAATAGARASAVSALHYVNDKGLMYKTALKAAMQDSDGEVRASALDAMFSCSDARILDGIRRLPKAAQEAVRNDSLDLLNRSRHLLPPAALTSLHSLLEAL